MKEELKNIIEKLEKNNQNEIINLMTNVYSDEENKKIASQIERINIEKVMDLYENASNIPFIDQSKIEHIGYTDLSSLDEEKFRSLKTAGEDVIKSGKYAVITMAGGQGTRLGHKGPKGTFKINTINGEKYLFEVIIDSLKKASGKYGVTIPWYVMTSDDNNGQTVSFLEEHDYFGYDKSKVYFFKQGNLPMVKLDGNMVVDQNKLIKEASDGNGGIYSHLKMDGMIDQMKKDGIEWVFVGGVDNILLRIVDPIMVGLTVKENNLIASKTVAKRNPEEKAGVFCKLDGKPKVIEYTELPKTMAEQVDENGKLVYGDINILSHLLNIKAIEKLADIDLPYHTAFKKSNYLDEKGNLVEVTEPNAYKFESYIFDGFSYFDEMSILRVKREEEFAPIKNASGSDSPETAVALYDEYNKKYNM